jgi:hypothetical protein
MIYTIILIVIGIAVSYFSLKIYSDEQGIAGGLLFILLGWLIWGFICYIPLIIVGINFETGRGEHTGYITATEKTGILFKTNTIYFKTDTQSSQEDTYCVIDEKVFEQLKEKSEKKEKITVQFYSLFEPGIKNCNFNGDIIYAVK